MARSVLELIRYRFLLFAGLLPFFLGQAIAYNFLGVLDFRLMFIALLGLFFTLVGVEAFNEYFDSRIGTDRVFSLERDVVPLSTFVMGIIGFAAAFAVMVFLTLMLGWQVTAIATIGGLFAAFYVMPPVKLAYRGLGELAIASSYGPLMTLGSFFVQTRMVSRLPLLASIVPMFLIFCVTVMNQIPDFYGDRIIGKRNITVRVGRLNAIKVVAFANALCFVYVVGGVLTGGLPRLSIISCLPILLSIKGLTIARDHIEEPYEFIKAIRLAIITYSSAVILLTIGYFLANSFAAG